MRLVVHPQAFRAALHPACDFNGHGVPDPIERRPREPTAMASAASLVHQDGGAQGLTALLLELPEVRDVRVGVVFAVAATAPQGIALCSLHVLRARDVAERLPEGPDDESRATCSPVHVSTSSCLPLMARSSTWPWCWHSCGKRPPCIDDLGRNGYEHDADMMLHDVGMMLHDTEMTLT